MVSCKYLFQLDAMYLIPVSLYNYENDPLLLEDLIDEYPLIVKSLEIKAKAFLQDYNNRILHNNMSLKTAK